MDSTALLSRTLEFRRPLFDAAHQTALRLFNGFYEGFPGLVVDLYARTLLIQNYANPPLEGLGLVRAAQAFYRAELPWLECILLKTRHAPDQAGRNGHILHGGPSARKIREGAAWYALDLTLHRDATFYLDTRSLRQWLAQTMRGQSLLNTFAYTGSLGVAALAGGAARVAHVDLNRAYLNVAKTSYTLNGFPITKSDFRAQDFFPVISALKREGALFDCAVLDAPFFSSTERGRVDLLNDSTRLINKLRPLVRDGGKLVAINNALFLSGADYLAELEALCADGHLEVDTLLPIPPDITGWPETIRTPPPSDPAPFNHPTKIAILKVRHGV